MSLKVIKPFLIFYSDQAIVGYYENIEFN